MNRSNVEQLSEGFTGPVFIYASGKSAKEFPLAKYKNEKFIVVNGAVREFIKAGVTPFSYIFDDGSFLKNNIGLVLEAIKVSKFVFMPYFLYIECGLNERVSDQNKNKIYFIDKVNRRNGLKLESYRLFFLKNILNKKILFKFSRIFYSSKNIGFSKDMAQGYFCARTIPYAALQLAYYLGFKKVFFVGLDLNVAVGRFYDKNDALPTTLDKDYPRHIYPSFKFVAKRIVNAGFEIYNLSAHSKLPENIMPKITLSQLEGFINEK